MIKFFLGLSLTTIIAFAIYAHERREPTPDELRQVVDISGNIQDQLNSVNSNHLGNLTVTNNGAFGSISVVTNTGTATLTVTNGGTLGSLSVITNTGTATLTVTNGGTLGSLSVITNVGVGGVATFTNKATFPLGSSLQVNQGLNSIAGIVTLTNGVANVATTNIAEGDLILLTQQAGTTNGFLMWSNVVAGVSFTVRSSAINSNSTNKVHWLILKQ